MKIRQFFLDVAAIYADGVRPVTDVWCVVRGPNGIPWAHAACAVGSVTAFNYLDSNCVPSNDMLSKYQLPPQFTYGVSHGFKDEKPSKKDLEDREYMIGHRAGIWLRKKYRPSKV